ncbi:MAG: hypothetical protein NT154_20375 [Verrucomicrobia bacterium]|nr:hypothetical protein [Verrucomicrobiota bacterium]
MNTGQFQAIGFDWLLMAMPAPRACADTASRVNERVDGTKQ